MFGPEFFPTPRNVARKMLAKISNEARNYLEPSAGKGDLAEVIRGDAYDGYDRNGRYGRHHSIKVDCIELSPELGDVLTSKDFPVVGYDWLTYTGVCYYDAIVMNPPFSNGDEHLLRAWDFLHDGEIVCLLNEETVKNPHTARRQRLAKLIEQHGDVEYLGDCFSTAQRKTDVRVALVYLKKQSDDDRIDLWASETAEKTVNDNIDSEANLPAIRDQLGNMQHYFDMANEHMLKAFAHIRKASLYMDANGVSDSGYKDVLPLALVNVNSARAEFIRKHRRDAWMKVFEKMSFRKWLDKKQTDEFIRDIETNANIQFTKENINGTLENVFLQRKKLFQKSVANVFDELTRYYNGNSNHSEGWKTNDSYKVNRKLIFPWGCEWDTIFNKFRLRWGRSCIDIYNDLDRILCVLDGENFEEVVTIERALNYAFDNKDAIQTKRTASRYFRIWFWKKGTVHLEFKDEKLWERFNIEAAAGKRWVGENTRDKGAA
jgi:hypothetical protein